MSSIKRQAEKDADEFAMAKMFYGEGAGTRRKLITQTVNFKRANIPGYADAFEVELARQDFAKLARQARRERKVKDTTKRLKREGKALTRLTVGETMTVVALGYYAHKTGLDKKAYDYSKKQYLQTKAKIQKKLRERKLKSV